MKISLFQTSKHDIYKIDVLLLQTQNIKEMVTFLSQLWDNNMGQFTCVTEKYTTQFSDGTLNFEPSLLSSELYDYSMSVWWHKAYTCELFQHFYNGQIIHTYEIEIRKDNE